MESDAEHYSDNVTRIPQKPTHIQIWRLEYILTSLSTFTLFPKRILDKRHSIRLSVVEPKLIAQHNPYIQKKNRPIRANAVKTACQRSEKHWRKWVWDPVHDQIDSEIQPSDRGKSDKERSRSVGRRFRASRVEEGSKKRGVSSVMQTRVRCQHIWKQTIQDLYTGIWVESDHRLVRARTAAIFSR